MSIGQAIKQERKRKGLTQRNLSNLTGISNTYISAIETDRRVPNNITAQRISEALDVPYAVIMWKAITDKMIKPEKRAIFLNVKPSIDALLDSIFQDENN